jgi:PIN domain nuclease of toxin-antitoxin system
VASVLADTHAAIWFLNRSPLLSEKARASMAGAIAAGDPVYVASISLVEIRYLVERARLPEQAFTALDTTLADPIGGLRIVDLDRDVARMLSRIPRDAVPDMPDRIIAASALARGVPLVTKDYKLQSAPLATIW